LTVGLVTGEGAQPQGRGRAAGAAAGAAETGASRERPGGPGPERVERPPRVRGPISRLVTYCQCCHSLQRVRHRVLCFRYYTLVPRTLAMADRRATPPGARSACSGEYITYIVHALSCRLSILGRRTRFSRGGRSTNTAVSCPHLRTWSGYSRASHEATAHFRLRLALAAVAGADSNSSLNSVEHTQ